MPPPTLHIPDSEHTVTVAIIDTTTRITGIPITAFAQPEIPGLTTVVNGCSYSFLVRHSNSAAKSKYDTLLFDLGTRKDFENGPKAVVEQSKYFTFKVEKNVFDILKDQGDDPAEVGGIIWSHFHVDHTGDPSVFPKSTALIVGPGFKRAFVPGWPTVEDSQVDEKAWQDRELREIDFESQEKCLMIGQYKAFDFYGDGSFYLIDSPGHAVGHISALARTSANPPEFIMMGGDVAHHGSEFRPTQFLPLPNQISPNPLLPPFTKGSSFCPGAMFEKIHPKKSSTEPFTHATGFIHDNTETACASVKKLFDLDAQDNIFSIIAHDKSLFDIVDFYPKTANDWKKKDWKEQGHWRFLRDFDTGSDEQAKS